eukprot:scaffold646_cov77-Phaeocystis_antarctica.AAC.4
MPTSRFVAKERASAAPLGTAEALDTAVALHAMLAAPAARSLARSSIARCPCMSSTDRTPSRCLAVYAASSGTTRMAVTGRSSARARAKITRTSSASPVEWKVGAVQAG